jgi:hypothetical protein
MKSFAEIKTCLHEGDVIKNWTRKNDFFGEDFFIVEVKENAIVVKPPSAEVLQVVPRKDFEAVISIWQDYMDGNFRRMDITPITRFSKYIISIIHHIECMNRKH